MMPIDEWDGWLNADGTSVMLRSDDAIDRHKMDLDIFKRILSLYCEKLKARESQSNGQNKQEEYA